MVPSDIRDTPHQTLPRISVTWRDYPRSSVGASRVRARGLYRDRLFRLTTVRTLDTIEVTPQGVSDDGETLSVCDLRVYGHYLSETVR